MMLQATMHFDIESAIRTLLEELTELKIDNHWEGRLASSALSTATAVSAFSILQYGPIDYRSQNRISAVGQVDTKYESLINDGCEYIVAQQNQDGGWGDTDRSNSNISTTLLCIAALTLAGEANSNASVIAKAWRYVDENGRWDGLKKRYGKDKTFAVPILTNCALAGLVDWKQVPPLPFEAAALPQSWYRFVRLPVVSYAIPALVAIGQVREHYRPIRNPLRWPFRKLAISPSLKVLRRMQPSSGGYLEAVPLTSFVMMSLAAKGLGHHEVVRDAIKYLCSSVRSDGSWPIDTNLATWVTSLAANALLSIPQSAVSSDRSSIAIESLLNEATIAWLLNCQHRSKHPFTGASPGGWGWSDLSGAVPDADDTPAALLALGKWVNAGKSSGQQSQDIANATRLGIQWLLGLQNRDGGWPTFCKGWGALPFDRSGCDLTAHAIRALYQWQQIVLSKSVEATRVDEHNKWMLPRIERAIELGWRYLQRNQSNDGSWLPLWFGNQDDKDESNKVYGTARVLVACAECEKMESTFATKARDFLVSCQNPDGGWGGGRSVQYAGLEVSQSSTIEETAQAVEALVACKQSTSIEARRGVEWLIQAIKNRRYREPQPIGFYFAKLWYYEQMYPIVYSLAAFGRIRSNEVD